MVLVSSPRLWAASIPAIAPTAVPNPQPMLSIRPTGMPTNRLASRFCAVARIAKPNPVRWNSKNSNTIMTIVATRIPRFNRPMQTSPAQDAAPLKTLKGPNPLGRGPQI